MANENIYNPGELAYELEGGSTAYNAMWMGYDKDIYDTPANGACRFLNIAETGSVVYAGLVFQVSNADAAHDQDIKVKVRGLDYNDFGELNSGNNPFSGKAYTTAYKDQDWGDTHIASYPELDVTNIVNEILGRGGWSSGNAMAFIIEDRGTASDIDRWIIANSTANAYLAIRKSAAPNFKPTPTTISAPSLPAAEHWGIKISKPGSSVLSAPEADLYFTTRRKTVKVLAEDIYISSGAGDTTIAHNLGYIPFVTVFGKRVGGSWQRLPIATYFTDRMTFFIDDTNLYLHSAASGEKFYYRIFVDRLTT